MSGTVRCYTLPCLRIGVRLGGCIIILAILFVYVQGELKGCGQRGRHGTETEEKEEVSHSTRNVSLLRLCVARLPSAKHTFRWVGKRSTVCLNERASSGKEHPKEWASAGPLQAVELADGMFGSPLLARASCTLCVNASHCNVAAWVVHIVVPFIVEDPPP